MKKLMLLFILSVGLIASEGESVFEKHCVSCHARNGMMGEGPMQDMKAPTMQMVSMRLKKMTGSKEAFVTFVKDYIQNPSQTKGFCMPMAYKRFGVMPPIGKNLSEEERDAVAYWIFDSFDDMWDKSMGGQMCNTRNSAK